MKAIIKNGTVVGCTELKRKPKKWLSPEQVLIVYESIIVNDDGSKKYSNMQSEWVDADKVFD